MAVFAQCLAGLKTLLKRCSLQQLQAQKVLQLEASWWVVAGSYIMMMVVGASVSPELKQPYLAHKWQRCVVCPALCAFVAMNYSWGLKTVASVCVCVCARCSTQKPRTRRVCPGVCECVIVLYTRWFDVV